MLDKPVSLYIYANYADLRGSIVAPEEWTGGVAYAGFNIISIGISPNNLDWGKEAVAHELGHLITHQVTVSPYGSGIPPWLDEGLAMHAEGPQSDSDKGALKKAIEDGTVATLQSLSSPFSADAKEAFYAYAQSRSVIEFLVDNFGKNKINDLLVLLNDGYSMDDALKKIYGFDLDGLDQAWMDWLMGNGKKGHGSLTVQSQPNGNIRDAGLYTLPQVKYGQNILYYSRSSGFGEAAGKAGQARGRGSRHGRTAGPANGQRHQR